MRRLFVLLGLIGLLAAPALADVTVRYKVKDQPRTITLAVADNGNARFDSGDGTMLIVRERAALLRRLRPAGPAGRQGGGRHHRDDRVRGVR